MRIVLPSLPGEELVQSEWIEELSAHLGLEDEPRVEVGDTASTVGEEADLWQLPGLLLLKDLCQDLDIAQKFGGCFVHRALKRLLLAQPERAHLIQVASLEALEAMAAVPENAQALADERLMRICIRMACRAETRAEGHTESSAFIDDLVPDTSFRTAVEISAAALKTVSTAVTHLSDINTLAGLLHVRNETDGRARQMALKIALCITTRIEALVAETPDLKEDLPYEELIIALPLSDEPWAQAALVTASITRLLDLGGQAAPALPDDMSRITPLKRTNSKN